jgi:hypothetical protein
MSLADDVKLFMVAAACTLVLVIIPENVIHVQLDFASKYSPLLVLIFYLFLKDDEKNSIFPWYLLMIYATAGVLILKVIGF